VTFREEGFAMAVGHVSRAVAIWGAVLAAVLVGGASPDREAPMSAKPGSYWEPPIYPLLNEFLGKGNGPYILPSWSVSEQVEEGLGSASPIDFLPLDDGNRLLWGCRRHSCDEKAAVILSAKNKVEAVGLVNFHCHFVAGYTDLKIGGRRRNYDCEGQPRLTLFLRKSGAHRETLERWAKSAVDRELPVEVVLVPSR
jgi:hypothetical protein